ncbi:MAG: hypothetical protein JW741_23240 [Sedimentisphaerales bacterium]|nr:hypothetical protein [Sedimentisphaerales bacterium]
MKSRKIAPQGPNAGGSRGRANSGAFLCDLCLIAALCLTSAGGCQNASENHAMAGSYYINPHKDLHKLGRVALVELDNTSSYPDVSADVTQALFLALQKKQVFSLTTVDHDDPAWRALQENIDSLQALRRLLAMRDTLRCNALLVGTVTEYRPYPQLVLGLRLKLLDLTDGQLLWGLEQIWDAADKSIQKRVETYFKKELRSGFAPLREDLVVISSREFIKFAAYETAQTVDREDK